jgi:methyl-accepting chemotaxis protein
MKPRPSTRILTLLRPRTLVRRSARSVRWGLVALVGLGAMIVLGAVAYTGLVVLKRSVAADEDARIASAAFSSRQLVDRLLAERARQVEIIASAPSVIAAAKEGGDASRRHGLPTVTAAKLDQMFRTTRSQQVDPEAMRFLSGLLARFDMAGVLVTDEYGFNAVATSPPADFVQNDEAWWRTAWSSDVAGATQALAVADGATKQAVIELAEAVRDRGVKAGVVKVKFTVAALDSVLSQATIGGSALRIDVVDSLGRTVASSASEATAFAPFNGFGTVWPQPLAAAFTYGSGTAAQRAATAQVRAAPWRVVAHMAADDATRGYDVARTALLAGVVAILALIMGTLLLVSRFIERRITGPAGELATAAEAVADGDLSTTLVPRTSQDEIGRLSRALTVMIDELRRLAIALNESATETSNMTTEITSSSEQMAASAGEIAHTAADLSQQSASMASTIQTLAASSEDLVALAATLDAGARDGVERNARLRALALENRARLDESTRSLTVLSTDVEANAASIEQLASASEEVRSFVTLVQKLARQSKLLALNAAMEAARAGDHGHGFGVVAEEVRRLAAMSSTAAERTERIMSSVLHGIAESRATSERSVETVRNVSSATELGSKSFGDIEAVVEEADAWTSSIERAVTTASGMARDMRTRLDVLSSGTEAFAAAMQQVAASSEEQSASTEEIAAAAATLSSAAERLNGVIANLRVESGHAPHVGQPSHAAHPPHHARPSVGTTHAKVVDPSHPHAPIRVPPSVKIGRMTPGHGRTPVK